MYFYRVSVTEYMEKTDAVKGEVLVYTQRDGYVGSFKFSKENGTLHFEPLNEEDIFHDFATDGEIFFYTALKAYINGRNGLDYFMFWSEG